MLPIYTVDCSIICETDSDDGNGSSMLAGENYIIIFDTHSSFIDMFTGGPIAGIVLASMACIIIMTMY